MNWFEILALFVSIAVSFTFLLLVDTYGIKLKLQWLFPAFSILTASLYIIIRPETKFFYLTIGFLTTPLAIFLVYNLFNLVSLQINKKELRLRYRNATNRKHKFLYGHEDKYRFTDTLFSFIILFLMIIWPAIFSAFLGKALW